MTYQVLAPKNSKLVHASEHRIIIPTIYWNNYLSALRALSINHIPDPLIRVLDFAQKYTSRIDFTSYEAALHMFQKTKAFLDPNQADEQGVRLILP